MKSNFFNILRWAITTSYKTKSLGVTLMGQSMVNSSLEFKVWCNSTPILSPDMHWFDQVYYMVVQSEKRSIIGETIMWSKALYTVWSERIIAATSGYVNVLEAVPRSRKGSKILHPWSYWTNQSSRHTSSLKYYNENMYMFQESKQA